MRQSVFDSYPEKRKRLSFFAAFADATNDEDEAVDVAQVAPILPTYFDSLPVLPAPVPLPLPGRGRGRGRDRAGARERATGEASEVQVLVQHVTPPKSVAEPLSTATVDQGGKPIYGYLASPTLNARQTAPPDDVAIAMDPNERAPPIENYDLQIDSNMFKKLSTTKDAQYTSQFCIPGMGFHDFKAFEDKLAMAERAMDRTLAAIPDDWKAMHQFMVQHVFGSVKRHYEARAVTLQWQGGIKDGHLDNFFIVYQRAIIHGAWELFLKYRLRNDVEHWGAWSGDANILGSNLGCTGLNCQCIDRNVGCEGHYSCPHFKLSCVWRRDDIPNIPIAFEVGHQQALGYGWDECFQNNWSSWCYHHLGPLLDSQPCLEEWITHAR